MTQTQRIVRSRFSPRDTSATVDCSGSVDRTKQSFKKECDINHIMAQYLKTGNINHLAKYNGQYMDCTSMTFQEALNTVIKAQEVFDELPSELRERFGHDPGKFLDFVHEPKNIEEMRKLGLAPEAPAQKTEEKTSVKTDKTGT